MTFREFSLGRVALVANDAPALGRWYETAVGLQPMGGDDAVRLYGAGDEVLLELIHDPAARRRNRREAGLFHTAFLLPERADLGAWVRNAVERRTPVDGASDHLVSEALYLTDPEGNGVEIYADRPRETWTWQNGQVAMSTEHLDLRALVDHAAGRDWKGFPAGSVIGHVHLQVGTIPEAEAFQTGKLGLDLTSRYPGGSFFAANGYHHHIATNTWNSRGAGPRDYPSTGLERLTIRTDAEAARVLAKKTGSVPAENGGFTLADPWGTRIAVETV